jgi:hypothetical protein
MTVFAHRLNVRAKLVSDWERGVKRPSEPSLKLLSLAPAKALDAIAGPVSDLRPFSRSIDVDDPPLDIIETHAFKQVEALRRNDRHIHIGEIEYLAIADKPAELPVHRAEQELRRAIFAILPTAISEAGNFRWRRAHMIAKTPDIARHPVGDREGLGSYNRHIPPRQCGSSALLLVQRHGQSDVPCEVRRLASGLPATLPLHSSPKIG